MADEKMGGVVIKKSILIGVLIGGVSLGLFVSYQSISKRHLQNKIFEYAVAYIDSLANYQLSSDSVRESPPKSRASTLEEAKSGFFSTLSEIRLSASYLKKASGVLEKFTTSSEPAISKSAKEVVAAYKSAAEITEKNIEMLEGRITGSVSGAEIDVRLNQAGFLMAEASEKIMRASWGVGKLLAPLNKQQESVFFITEKQRGLLTNYLKNKIDKLQPCSEGVMVSNPPVSVLNCVLTKNVQWITIEADGRLVLPSFSWKDYPPDGELLDLDFSELPDKKK